MNNKKLKKLILRVLKKDDRLWNEDKTEFNEILLIDLVEHIDEKVIGLLLEEKDLREKFFVKIKDVYVFKTNDFHFFMEENKVDNSYTDYKNRIGLTDGKKFLKDTNDVVLDFPYKDCVLEGGQSSEEGTDTYFEWQEEKLKDKLDENGNKIKDGRKNVKEVDVEAHYERKQAKRKEIFFNSVLAHDEIDRLLDAKALTNWKRFDKNGELSMVNGNNGELSMVNGELRRKEDGTIVENMIIKGNNLLALHSLKKQFAGKVKLIYIDPPYNTGNDGFKYNDNFNHSTWLTFMKNRLEVAKELLRDDGVIFVQCDDTEQAYLKILMDDIFSRRKSDYMVWQKTDPRYDQNTNSKIINRFKRIHEHILIAYKSNKNNYIFNKIYRFPEWSKKQPNPDNDVRGGWQSGIISFKEGHNKENKNSEYYYTITLPSGRKMTRHFFVFKEEFENLLKDNRIYFPKNGDGVPRLKIFENEEKDYYCDSIIRGFGTSSIAKKELEELGFNLDEFDTPKPEKLIAEIIRMTTKEEDIVLDFYTGSGTTGAVAHKMNRQYVLVEQMDYVEDIACERMKKVIDGEQGGISKSVNWQGGGDFIYFELAKWNETAKEKIQNCENVSELISFFDEMYERYFLNYNLKIKEFKEKVIKEEEFKNLTLEEQKKMFIAMLDNNQMYVNKTEMEDKKFGIGKEDQKLTKEFYK